MLSLTDRFVPGDRIGTYRVERELGTSGAGLVFAAVHVVLPRRAIIKVMHAAVAGHEAFALQLLREACILEALAHPGVPRVYDSGVLPDGRPWFAIEHVAEGVETLADRLVAAGPMHATEVAILARDLAEVLEHAHRRGVVHRGLRPDRIALATHNNDFSLCVLDWSDARAHDAKARIPHLPPPGARAYLAPEQVRGDALDDRADVYALGAIAYQALTGAFPYAGVRVTLGEQPAHIPVRERCPTAPRDLATLIDQMVAHDRFDRPSAAEVRADLDWLVEVAAQTPVTPTPAPVALARIRKPRWTPAFGYRHEAGELAAAVIELVADEPS